MIFLAFLFPLAIYCFVLAQLNRSRHPVMVSGSWDFAGVLFAASGFLLFGGPAILAGVYEDWRLFWLLGQARFPQTASRGPGLWLRQAYQVALEGVPQKLGENWSFWMSLWFVYFAAILAVSFWLVRRRRNQTSIYNVKPEIFDSLLAEVLDRLGFAWRRVDPDRIFIQFRGSIELQLEPFAALRHMTLRWRNGEMAVRGMVEADLAKSLTLVPTHSNPAGTWFLALSLGLFFLVFSGLFVLVALRVIALFLHG